MPYIKDGKVVKSRSIFDIRRIPELFFAIINFIIALYVLFSVYGTYWLYSFHTMISIEASDRYKTSGTTLSTDYGGRAGGGSGSGRGDAPRRPIGTMKQVRPDGVFSLCRIALC